MAGLDSRLVMGATLFATPDMKGGGTSLPGIALLVVVVLVVVVGLVLGRFSRPGPSDPNDGEGWGNGPRGPEPQGPERPRGGIPLDDAAPAPVRLRAKAGSQTCCQAGETTRSRARPAAGAHSHPELIECGRREPDQLSLDLIITGALSCPSMS